MAMKVKKGDLVQMLSGKDRGKQGRIIDAQAGSGRVIVENLNQVTRHTKPRPMRDAGRMGGQQMTPGGRIAIFTSVRGRSMPLRSFESVMQSQGGIRMFEQSEIVDALMERGFADVRQRVTGFTQFVGGRLA